MNDLGIALILVTVFSMMIKRSLFNFIWSIRFFFTGLALILVEQSKDQQGVVAIVIYVFSITLIFILIRHLYNGREHQEDIDRV